MVISLAAAIIRRADIQRTLVKHLLPVVFRRLIKPLLQFPCKKGRLQDLCRRSQAAEVEEGLGTGAVEFVGVAVGADF